MKVSVIIPVVRPEKAKRCIKAVHKNAGISKKQYEVIPYEDPNNWGCPKMVKNLVMQARGEMICFLGDDTIPKKDFLKNAIKAMLTLPDNWGLVGLNDNPHRTLTATHWLAHKKLLPHLDGEFFHTGYKHCFCDDELQMRCHQMGRYIYAYDAVVEHDHPIFDEGEATPLEKINLSDDEHYKGAYAHYDEDQALFNERRATNWGKAKPPEPKQFTKVTIGIASGDMVYADFAMCLMHMCTFSMSYGVLTEVLNQKSSIIEIGRNKILEVAKTRGTDYLMTLDSDMMFPADTLIRLLQHKKSVVGCDASMRREPFDTVVRDMDGNRLDYTKKLDPLVPLKGGSCAVQLIKASVLDSIKAPAFKVEFNEDGMPLGEDYYFSNKLREAKHAIWCDTELSRQIGHIGCQAYYIKDQEEGDDNSDSSVGERKI